MFDVPIDAWYAWVGLLLASVAVVGVAGSLPTTPPPDAAGIADTVDRVAAEDVPSTAEHPVAATDIRIEPRGVSLRNEGGTTHATFAFGPVTPVTEGTALQRVVYGTPPDRAFDSKRAFSQSVVDARSREPTWEPVARTVVVRKVTWEGVDVTLVDA
ncbi:MAG: DUF7283 family protein [Halobacteriota archaeon]